MSPTVTTPKPSAAPDLPAEPPPPATPGPLRNGNPRGNPNLAPRCGAKNRAGNPCCAPAMANGRCRLHGGKCTGPRTAKGKADFKAAHTKHGRTTAPKRAASLYTRTLNVRSRLTQEAHRLSAHLPPDMAARLAKGPEELWPPVHLTNQPYVTNPESAWLSAKSLTTAARAHAAPKRSAAPTPHGLAAERLAARAEKAAMAPWRQAIAAARAAKCADRAAKREVKREAKAARRQVRATRTAARPTQSAPRAPAADRQTRTAHPNAPPVPPNAPPTLIVPYTGDSLLERELAARAAGLRAQANRSLQAAPTPGPTAPFKPSRIDPLNREPAAKSANAPFKPFRIDPLNREPAAKPDSTAPFKPFRIDPLNREPSAKPGSIAPFKPSRIDPLNREQRAEPPLTSPTPTNDQTPPAPLNRAARRHLKYLQRRRDRAAR
jgi:hypothetical protein